MATSELSELQERRDWKPPELIQVPAVFVWPPRPVEFLKSIFGFPGYLLPWNILYALLATFTWWLATPSPAITKVFAPGWISVVFFRNCALILLVASVWHLSLYSRKNQGASYKYCSRWPATDNRRFLFRDQIYDNAFWTFASAVPIWTIYEVTSLWAQANGIIPVVSWQKTPLYSLGLMICIPLLNEAHFYLIHRFLHWPPIYRAVHRLHHKNVNFSPWSGLAMHPVEHVLYFSAVLMHWVIPSHPLHVIYHLQHLALSPAQGHSGFGKLVLGGRQIDNNHYVHYLHHKYFEVNYGADQFVPMDKWFGTFHDGSEAGQRAMFRRLQGRRGAHRT